MGEGQVGLRGSSSLLAWATEVASQRDGTGTGLEVWMESNRGQISTCPGVDTLSAACGPHTLVTVPPAYGARLRAINMWPLIFSETNMPHFFFLPVHIAQLQTRNKQKFVDVHKMLLKFTTLLL